MEQWLVRTAENVIAGPYDKQQVLQLIRQGRLGSQDEVCRANSYWVFLHEHEEVLRHMGREAVQLLLEGSGEDATQTQTQTEPGLEREEETLAEQPAPGELEKAEIELQKSGRATDSGTQEETTAVLNLGRLQYVPLRRKPLPEAAARALGTPGRPLVLSAEEQKAFSWWNVVWLIGVLVFLIFAGLYLLN